MDEKTPTMERLRCQTGHGCGRWLAAAAAMALLLLVLVLVLVLVLWWNVFYLNDLGPVLYCFREVKFKLFNNFGIKYMFYKTSKGDYIIT